MQEDTIQDEMNYVCEYWTQTAAL